MKFQRWLKDNRGFVLTLICICGSLVLKSQGRDLDLDILLPSILGIYITGRTSEKVSAHINSRLDPDADLADVIKTLDNQDQSK